MFFLRKLFRRDTQPLTDGTTPPAGDRPVAVEAPHEHEDAQPGGASQDQAAAPYDAAGPEPEAQADSAERPWWEEAATEVVPGEAATSEPATGETSTPEQAQEAGRSERDGSEVVSA